MINVMKGRRRKGSILGKAGNVKRSFRKVTGAECSEDVPEGAGEQHQQK